VPAGVSLEEGYLPLGLASDVALTRDIAEGEALRWTDVVIDASADAVKVRREMELLFGVRPSGSDTVGSPPH
jgi:predicted homoserine dehydrogenase-like protein